MLEIEDDILTVDRSTLERYANCPAQARLVESGIGQTAGTIAAVGNEVHLALSEAVSLYVDSGGSIERSVLMDELSTNLRQSRPDVQPQVLKAFRGSVWSWCDWLWRISPANILRFDGGRGTRSGQLSRDIETAGRVVRITSELDFLHATDSLELLQEVDWKSGWKPWTVEAIADSFQMQMHACLVLHNYPDIECLRTRIWSRRLNGLTWAVEFPRRRYQEWETRVLSAAADFVRWHETEGIKCEARPAAEKCRICPAAIGCPVVDIQIKSVKDEPSLWLDRLAAIEASGDAIREYLGSLVDASGKDIVGHGIAFGNEKPKSTRKTAKQVYSLGAEREPGDGA